MTQSHGSFMSWLKKKLLDSTRYLSSASPVCCFLSLSDKLQKGAGKQTNIWGYNISLNELSSIRPCVCAECACVRACMSAGCYTHNMLRGQFYLVLFRKPDYLSGSYYFLSSFCLSLFSPYSHTLRPLTLPVSLLFSPIPAK